MRWFAAGLSSIDPVCCTPPVAAEPNLKCCNSYNISATTAPHSRKLLHLVQQFNGSFGPHP